MKGLVTLLPAKPLAEERVRRVHVNTKLTGRRLTPKFKEGVTMTQNLRWFLENLIYAQTGKNKSGHNFGIVDFF